MNDYERVAGIIRYLDASHTEQPDLDDLAGRAGLSRFHFHRLFTRWAGVTPKDFLQVLTLNYARERLRRGRTVLETTFDSGLSSPARLHDLFVTLEAATPGEIKAGGEGWSIEAGFAASPFGRLSVAVGPRGMCHLSFIERGDRHATATALKQLWPRAQICWNDEEAARLAAQIFRRPADGDANPAEERARNSGLLLRAFVRATPFQLRVWRALLQVPPGALVNYAQIATAIGNTGAARAVGSAVSANPLAFLIPCHRVIRETGVVGEYRWGRERKRIILSWEATRSVRPPAPVSS